MIRALDELRIDGIATTVPADLAILRHADFQTAEHSTKWVEDRLDLTGVSAVAGRAAPATTTPPKVQRDVDVEVNGKRFSVKVWVPDLPVAVGRRRAAAAPGPDPPSARPRRAARPPAAAGSPCPMQGTIVKVLVEVGQAVEAGQRCACSRP